MEIRPGACRWRSNQTNACSTTSQSSRAPGYRPGAAQHGGRNDRRTPRRDRAARLSIVMTSATPCEGPSANRRVSYVVDDCLRSTSSVSGLRTTSRLQPVSGTHYPPLKGSQLVPVTIVIVPATSIADATIPDISRNLWRVRRLPRVGDYTIRCQCGVEPVDRRLTCSVKSDA